MNKKEIQALVKSFGTQGDFAKLLSAQIGPNGKVLQQSVSQWTNRGSIPVKYCGYIEALTKGEVTAHAMRPDVFPPA